MDINHIIEDLEKIEKERKDIGRSVTIFGGSRFKEDSFYYKKAKELGKKIADLGYSVITGGSSGVMEGANSGAITSSSGKSIGIHMEYLPTEERPNIYVDKKLEFHYFFTRKIALIDYSDAYIIMPGGFGTLDEFFEVLNLVRTKNHKPSPIVLFDSNYWAKLYSFMSDTMLEYETINRDDLNLISLANSIDEVIDRVKNI